MNKRIFSVVLIIAFIVMPLCGCQEDKKETRKNPPATGSAVTSSQGKDISSEPEYQYEEFINTEEPDTSELGKDEGTDEEAEEVENDVKKIDKKIKAVDKQYRKNGVVKEGDVLSYLWEVGEKLKELYDKGDIADYEEGTRCIEVTLNSGVKYIIAPEIKDCDDSVKWDMKN